jgi:hypothetical protein
MFDDINFFKKIWNCSLLSHFYILILTLLNVLDWNISFVYLSLFQTILHFVHYEYHILQQQFKCFFKEDQNGSNEPKRLFINVSSIHHPSTFIHHMSLYNLILLNLIMNICYNVHDSMLTTHALVFAKTRTPKMDHFMRLQLSQLSSR